VLHGFTLWFVCHVRIIARLRKRFTPAGADSSEIPAVVGFSYPAPVPRW
jgi:hypothetical protein